MRNVTVYPSSANGVVAAPSSIDEALSAIVLAAITKTSVRGAGSSVDTICMFNGLFAMGAKFRQQEDIVTFYTAPKPGSASIECTSKVLVFLLPMCIVLGGEYTFLGEFDSHIIAELKSLDIDWSVSEQGVTIRSNRQNRDIALEVETFAPGFMLALPLNGGAKLTCSGGKKFAELTVAIMQDFGYKLCDQEGYSIAKHRKVDTNYIYSVGGDYGKSAYLLLAGFLSGEVGVTGLLAGSMQSGRSVIDEFKDLKLRVSEMNGAVFAKKSRVGEAAIDVSAMAEPIVALVLACFCKGKCVIKNAKNLSEQRREEFDITAKALQSIGADIIKIGQEHFITGSKKLFGGNVNARGSQNIAMALAAAGLVSEIGVTLSNAPSLDVLQRLGVTIQ